MAEINELIWLSEAVAWLAYGRPMNCETQCEYERTIGFSSEQDIGPPATYTNALKRILKDAESGRLVVYGHRKAIDEDPNFPTQYQWSEQIPSSAFVGDLQIAPAEPYALRSSNPDVQPAWFRLQVNTSDFIERYPQIHSGYRPTRAPSEQDAIFEAVARGEMRTEEAEAWAKARSLPAFSGPQREFDPMGEVFWTLPMTLAWIIWRNADGVRRTVPCRSDVWEWFYRPPGFRLEAPKNWTIWDMKILADYADPAIIVSPRNALSELAHALKSGKLTARGFIENNPPAMIDCFEWEVLKLDHPGGEADAVYSASPPRLVYERVLVSRSDAMEIWKSLIREGTEQNHDSLASKNAAPETLESATVDSAEFADLPSLQRAILEIASELWPNRRLPSGLTTTMRDEQILAVLAQRHRSASDRTIRDAMKHFAQQ